MDATPQHVEWHQWRYLPVTNGGIIMVYGYDYYAKVAVRFRCLRDRDAFCQQHPRVDAVLYSDIQDVVTGHWKAEYDSASETLVEYENPAPIVWC